MILSCNGASIVGSTGINADALYVSKDKKVFLLTDGASGAGEHGKVLMSKTCVEIATSFDYSTSGLKPKAYVDTLFRKINQRLIEISQEFGTRVFGTIIIAVYENGVLTVTTLGDSPAYLFSNGTITRVAKNKKRYEAMIDRGIITRAQYDGYIDQMHDAMKACFDFFLPEIVPNNVIHEHAISPDDIFLMCSDGLSDWVSVDEIFEVIKEKGLDSGIDILLNQAKEISLKKSKYFDDTTALVLRWL